MVVWLAQCRVKRRRSFRARANAARRVECGRLRSLRASVRSAPALATMCALACRVDSARRVVYTFLARHAPQLQARPLLPGSSMVEHSAVNRRVASSNLARGAILPPETESATQHVTTTRCGCNKVQLGALRLEVQSPPLPVRQLSCETSRPPLTCCICP
jgi:hypothetical protein